MKASRILVPVVIAGLLGAGIYWRITKNNQASAQSSGRATPASNGPAPNVSAGEQFDASAPVAVRGVEVIRDTLIMKVTADGQADAARSVTISAPIEGPIQRVHVRENTYVRAGDVLVSIDPRSLRYDLESALADSARVWNQFHADTIGDGLNPNAAERAAHAAAAMQRSGIPANRLQLEELRERIAEAEVRAPFAGRVAEVQVVQDQRVTAGAQLLTLLQIDPIHVVVQVTETDISQIRVGRGADVEFTPFPDEVFRGRIIAQNPDANNLRAYRVTVSIPNPQGRILPGMFAEAKLDGERHPDMILVPIEAVIERDIERRPLVFIFQGDSETGTAQWQYVTRGLRNDEYVQIIDDPEDTQDRLLDPGEIVLVAGHELLQHQVHVRLVSNVSAQGGRPR